MLSHMIYQINKKFPKDIDEQLSLRAMIDIQFKRTKKFVLV